MTDRAVRFDRTGDVDVLRLVDIETPDPGEGEIRVRVAAAGLNPVDWKIFGGAASSYALELPSGNGNDLAGTVDAVGAGVSGFAVGDRVCGGARFHAQADHAVLAGSSAVRVPDAVPLEIAATVDIVGRTAVAALDAVHPTTGETVLISGASGGLGSMMTQLAARTGARVLGTGSASSAGRIAELGGEPIEYGDGLAERVRELAPGGVDAVLDCAGHGTVAMAIGLGVDPRRINTNADHSAVERWGVQNRGGHTDPSAEPLRGLLDLIAAGELRVRIAARYPLERVREAYRDLMGDHTQGKIVLVLDEGAAR